MHTVEQTPDSEQQRPWEELQQLVAAGDAGAVETFLDSLPSNETARALSRLSDDDQAKVLVQLEPADAAGLIEHLADAQAAELIATLEPQAAAAIVDELPSDEQADLLGQLDVADAEAILEQMQPELAEEARELASYDEREAGGLMITEYLAYPAEYTTQQVIDDLRSNAEEYADYDVQYAYVVDAAERLVGVLPLRDLLLSRPGQRIEQIMIHHPITIGDHATLDEIVEFFDEHNFFGVPVVNEAGEMLGVVRRVDMEEAYGDRADDDFRKAAGIIAEELRSMPLLLRARRRLAWLSINILLNVIAASVIAFYTDTLQQVIALAVFLPIISDMSGNSGAQAVAVSMRELTLGLIKPTELAYVFLKEITVGTINGCALGGLIAAVAWLWQGNAWLGLVVGAALALNTIVAVALGGLIPLWLKRLKLDPALASGPILTTVTDMAGFFFVLSFASALLPKLI
ncbi:MAG: magnesium transporter [Pirellulales bacterium]